MVGKLGNFIAIKIPHLVIFVKVLAPASGVLHNFGSVVDHIRRLEIQVGVVIVSNAAVRNIFVNTDSH